MDNKQIFRKYYGRLAFEGVLKALVWGFAVGLLAFTVTAFICWAVSYDPGIWIALGIGVAAIAVTTVVLYYVRFRPTAKEIARRIDALGLEERMITMAELQKNDTYIAMRQREDAQQKLQAVEPKQINYQVSALSISLAGAAAALAIAMGVVFALSIYDVLPPGNQVLTPEEEKEFVLVSYMEMDGGSIAGETDQVVEVGSDTQAVLAVADEGFVFVKWSDGVEEPSRQDLDVQEDIFVFAEFAEMGEGEDGEGGEGEPGDQPQDQPQDSEPSDSDDSDENQQPGEQPQDPNGNPGSGAGGGTPNYDYVNDGNGKVDYNEIFDEYLKEALDEIASGELPDGLREFLESYFGSL